MWATVTTSTTANLTINTITVAPSYFIPTGSTNYIPIPNGVTPGNNIGWFRDAAQNEWLTSYHSPEEQAKRERAKKKALSLLRQNVSAKQWKDYKELGYFEVISQKGNVYRIYEGRSRNVKKIVDGKVAEILCAHPGLQVPNPDTLLSQKLMLECEEDTFRNIANIDRSFTPYEAIAA